MLRAHGDARLKENPMKATILSVPETFDRVDRVKESVGQEPRPGDDRLWILGGPLVVEIEAAPLMPARYVVPTGFTTDGASVPRLAQRLTGWRPWDEPQRWGAIVHDWLYCANGSPEVGGLRCGKPYADRAFRAVLSAAGASALRAEVMFLAVHLFGGPAYSADQAHGPEIWN
jgi:hypothetical protein